MRTHFERTLPATTWGTSMALCLLAALGGLAIARSAPASYAAVAQGSVRSADPAGGVETRDTQSLVATAAPADGRKRSRCPECGTIESMRKTDLASYEITVRLRDGTTTVFNEATPRAWRPGGRVMVIGGLQVASR